MDCECKEILDRLADEILSLCPSAAKWFWELWAEIKKTTSTEKDVTV